jgi:hypothetical protein
LIHVVARLDLPQAEHHRDRRQRRVAVHDDHAAASRNAGRGEGDLHQQQRRNCAQEASAGCGLYPEEPDRDDRAFERQRVELHGVHVHAAELEGRLIS